MRVLNKVRCAICDYETYDGMVEKHSFTEIEEFVFKAEMHTECPECGNIDCFKPINQI